MSGGSMNYISNQLEEYVDMLEDAQLAELGKDFCTLLHACEWYQSGDTSEGAYNKAKIEFKNKWLSAESVKKTNNAIINQKIKDLKNELIHDFGFSTYCKECKYFHKKESSQYGDCDIHPTYMSNMYEYSCERFTTKDEK